MSDWLLGGGVATLWLAMWLWALNYRYSLQLQLARMDKELERSKFTHAFTMENNKWAAALSIAELGGESSGGDNLALKHLIAPEVYPQPADLMPGGHGGFISRGEDAWDYEVGRKVGF